MTDLHQMKCVACRGGVPTLTDEEIADLRPDVPEWDVIEVDGVKRLERTFKLKNFIEAIAFTNKIAMTAEKEDHHPFLIVTKDQFSALRSKSDQEPWKTMKEDAIQRSAEAVDAKLLKTDFAKIARALVKELRAKKLL